MLRKLPLKQTEYDIPKAPANPTSHKKIWGKVLLSYLVSFSAALRGASEPFGNCLGYSAIQLQEKIEK